MTHKDTSYAYASGDDKRRVVCPHCDAPQEIAAKTMSATCRSCSKTLRLEEVRIAKYEARRVVETCSTFTVERKGQMVADKIACGSAVLRGKVKGHLTSRGPVLIGPEAEVTGNITAPVVVIPEGAILEGNFSIGPAAQLPSATWAKSAA